MLWLLCGLAACDDASDAETSGDAVPSDGAPDATADGTPDAMADGMPDAGPADIGPDSDEDPSVRWNHGQARGTHNSSHIALEFPAHPTHAYSHAPLNVQLEAQAVRQFELDIHRHVDGHFEVFHLPLLDPLTVCQRFSACLDEMRVWSEANPAHFPVMVWIEPKDEFDFAPPYEAIQPAHFEDFDAEIRAGLGDRIFTPDDLRGDHDTLPEAVAAGWPPLHEMRGHFVFAMLDGGGHRDAYTEADPTLVGRPMFVHSDDPEDPFAAVFKINNAESEAERVGRLAARGFVITSNVDSAEDDDENNARKRDASLAAGAHFLSSDFPAPVDDRDYWLEVPGGEPVRCNPVSAPPDCEPQRLE